MLGKMLDNVRGTTPLIHCITNYVTVNDCANVVLACGGSPIMADDSGEAEDITSICGGLVINIGTLNKNTISSMILAGKKANELSHPVVLDPVGAGASKLRTDTALKLLNEINFSIIRGNISEIKTLANGSGTTKGVDSDISDLISEDNLEYAIEFAKKFAKRTGSVIAITGAIDIITDGEKTAAVRNGKAEMSLITGTGCMLSAITAAYATANKDNIFYSTVAAVTVMGLAGERGFARMTPRDGNSSYRNYIIDEIYNMDRDILKKGGKVQYIGGGN